MFKSKNLNNFVKCKLDVNNNVSHLKLKELNETECFFTNKKYIIVGKKQSGKTSLIRYIGSKLMTDHVIVFSNLEKLQFPSISKNQYQYKDFEKIVKAMSKKSVNVMYLFDDDCSINFYSNQQMKYIMYDDNATVICACQSPMSIAPLVRKKFDYAFISNQPDNYSDLQRIHHTMSTNMKFNELKAILVDTLPNYQYLAINLISNECSWFKFKIGLQPIDSRLVSDFRLFGEQIVDSKESKNPTNFNPTNFLQSKQEEYLYEKNIDCHDTHNYPGIPSWNEILTNTRAQFGKTISYSISDLGPFDKSQYFKALYISIKLDQYIQLGSYNVSDFIEKVKFSINEKCFQMYNGTFLDVFNNFTDPFNSNVSWTDNLSIRIPINFIKNENFPLALINKQDFSVNIEFREHDNLKMDHSCVWGEFIYYPRHQFYPTLPKNQYLLQRIYWTGSECIRAEHSRIRLNFRCNLKSIIWSWYLINKKSGKVVYPEFTIQKDYSIMLNGKSIFRKPFLLSLEKPTDCGRKDAQKNRFFYSFANNPKMLKPTGSLNIGNSNLLLCVSLDLKEKYDIVNDYDLVVDIFGIGYNIMEFDEDNGYSFII
tara:strand:- start:5966 stop:7753 length:1788 start_codon:yes stop_codon:yes gene_type:complete